MLPGLVMALKRYVRTYVDHETATIVTVSRVYGIPNKPGTERQITVP